MTRRILYLTAALALAVTLPLAASTFLALDQSELVAQSDAVVQGTVISTQSFWDAKGIAVVTEAMIQVGDVVTGDAPAIVTVRTFGGEVQGFRVEAHGFPTFEKGQEVLLFLERAADDTIRVAGHQQGLYRIRHNKSGVTVAVPAMDPETRLFRADGTLGPKPKAVSLDNLKSSVRLQAQSLRGGMIR